MARLVFQRSDFGLDAIALFLKRIQFHFPVVRFYASPFADRIHLLSVESCLQLADLIVEMRELRPQPRDSILVPVGVFAFGIRGIAPFLAGFAFGWENVEILESARNPITSSFVQTLLAAGWGGAGAGAGADAGAGGLVLCADGLAGLVEPVCAAP